MTAAIGVGFVGCGPVTQAIHLPTLAALDANLRVAHVMDVDAAPPMPPRTAGADGDGRAARAAVIEAGILGLATHALPLVRRFARSVDELLGARALEPCGYDLAFRSGDCTVELLAVTHAQSRPDWTLEVWGEGAELHAGFPPSYVLAGSATVTVRTAGGERRWHSAENGCQAEWRHEADVAAGRCEPTVTVEDPAANLALALNAAAVGHVLEAA